MRKKGKVLMAFAAGALTCFLVCAMAVPGFAATVAKTITVYTGISLYYDGVEVEPTDAVGNPVEPFLYEGTTYLPVRAISDLLGVEVNWDGVNKRVYLGDMPGKVTYLGVDLEPYYHSQRYYTASSTFQMDGKTYMNGFQMSSNQLSENNYAVFNLNGQYGTLQFDIGHTKYPGLVDTARYKKQAIIYLDDVLTKVIELEPLEMVKHIQIPLNGAAQLKIEVDGSIGFANAQLT